MKTQKLCLVILFLVGCTAAPLRTSVAPFHLPNQIPHEKIWQLTIGAEVLDTQEKSKNVFGTDLSVANILPVHLIVENTGSEEYEIDASQFFAVANDMYYPAFNLDQAAKLVRESSIGTTVAGQAILGAIAGTVAGAAVGAAAGSVAGDTGTGAGYGAAIGGSLGGVSGAVEGTSDRYTYQFRHELAVQDFGDRVIFSGDLQRGFIYFQVQPYTKLRVKVTNITKRKTQVIEIPIQVLLRNETTGTY